MSAESRDPDQGSGPPRTHSAGNEIKGQGRRHNQQEMQYLQQTSSKRCFFLGLETSPELVWEDWDLGKEFTKTLVLKNKYSKLQKLHLRPPVSKFFTTLIPQLIVVSPGISFSVPVIFKPLQRCEYEDSIEFQSKDGSFQVCLRAIIPCHSLEVPDSVLLPVCAVEHSSQTTFRLKNASKLQTCFQWVCSAPFQLSPEKGLLKPYQECHITVVFQPQEALVYQQHAYCTFGEENNQAQSSCTVLLQGLAKYPYLQLRIPGTLDEKEKGRPGLHFGSVAIGQSLQKHFDICNLSPVSAFFSLSRLPGGVPLFGSEFICDVTKGKVASGGSLRATVTYSPSVVDTVSVEYLSLKCRGALNEPLLKLTGTCIGPTVSLSTAVVDFGCVKEGEIVIQTMKLVNSSPVEAIYQWDLDCNGHSVFSIQPACGTVCPRSHTTLKAVYKPTQPIAHYRRVACLILHREPLFLDLIGTCHSELQQPAILKPEHLILYKLHWYRRQDPPGDLSSTKQVDQQGITTSAEESNQRPDSSPIVQRSPMEELYQSCLGLMDPVSSSSSLLSPHISVVPNKLLFNHKLSSSLSTSSACFRFVSITNHTRGKLSVVWTVSQDSPFTVSPVSCDLAPLKSTSFRVTYSPKQLNTLHETQLECFAFYRLQDRYHIGEQLLCPPWCVTVRVIGHSFQPDKEHFVPCCSLKPPRVVFPALSVLSYRTALLQNGGDLPLTFCQDQSSNSAVAETVSLIPSCGIIQPGDHQILTLRTTPTEDSPKQGFTLQLQLNAAKHTKELTVVSVAKKPCVSLERDSSLYFQPTAVGSQTQRTYHIRNLSHLPLRFQWSIPELDQRIIRVEPGVGELHPNESTMQTWTFSPLEEKTYKVNPTLTFWPIQMDGSNKSELTLKVHGIGSNGFLEAKEAVIDVGEVLVGTYESIEIPLVNNSPCAMSFCLSVQQRLLEDEPVDHSETESNDLQLKCDKGIIAPQCTMLLRPTVSPQRRAQYSWTISYQTLNCNGCVSSSPLAVCEVRAQGVFPTLQVVDVCSGGSMGRLSKEHLWKLLSLDSLNKHMLSNTSSSELTYRIPTRHSLHSYHSIFTKAILDFNFSAAPLNSDPSTFVLMFHNPRSFPVDWTFLFPEDQQNELEYWAETGELDSTELCQMKVQDSDLFSISPRSGTLHPGQQNTVHFSYSHKFVGTNRFPVVFKLSYGREVLLHFEGVTVERERPHLHVASNQHVFTSVNIGDFSPPRQVYELHNAGAVPVHYEVDTAVLSQLQVDNFNHPVLRCLNPVGEVLPGKSAMLEWIFSPLEPKIYHMDIPIHIQDGDSTLVSFEGCGFDSRTLGTSNPFTCSDSMRSVPRKQRVSFPGQVVFLSEGSISLGDIPVLSKSSRILFLTNMSQTETFHYTWNLPQEINQQVVQIHPEGGSLCPGDSALCALTFTSADYPTVYRLDLICQVTQEAAMVHYQKALLCWKQERERQQDELTLMEQSLTEIQGVLADKGFVAPPVSKGPPLRKYKPLPPICSSSLKEVRNKCDRPTKTERQALRQTVKQVQKQPEAPQPSLLHLEVTAHSHGLPEYLTHFPDQFNKHYRYLLSDKDQKSETTFSSANVAAGLPQLTRGPEKEIVVPILMSLLKDILDDSSFIQTLNTMLSKPITYQPAETSPSPRPSPDVSVRPTSSRHKPEPVSGNECFEPELNEEDNLVDRTTAQCLDNTPNTETETQNTLHPEYVPRYIAEDVLLNTLQNLMMEAVRGELVLTAHPRAVMLPPVSARTKRMSRAAAEEERENSKREKETAGSSFGASP